MAVQLNKNERDIIEVSRFLDSEIKATQRLILKSYYLLVMVVVVIVCYALMYIWLAGIINITYLTITAFGGLVVFAGWQAWTLESSRRYVIKVMNWYLESQARYHNENIRKVGPRKK